MKFECPIGARLSDFLAGELSFVEQRQIETHLRECAECSKEHASLSQLIKRLRSLPKLETSRDLASLVLARVHEPAREFTHRKSLLLWSAAAVALLSFLPFLHRNTTSAPPVSGSIVADIPGTSLDLAINWLCTRQEPDGSWNAEKWGGNRNFKVALTALPTIAVIGRNASTPERAAAARAIAWLRAQQLHDGTFGPDGPGIPYNHSIATLALLHAYRQHQEPDLKRQVDSAIAAIVRAQGRDGGWGWKGSLSSDLPITKWHIEALRLANELGFGNSKAALDRSLAWASAQNALDSPKETSDTSNGLVLTDNDRALGKSEVDLCRSYFLTITLQRRTDEISSQRLAVIRQDLVHHQVLQGGDSGSWPPVQQWGRSGGRIYSTALASLALANH